MHIVPLTVVMPAYNEEASIVQAIKEACCEVLACVPGSELLAVDDGSSDRTGKLLDGLAIGDPRLRVIHQCNAGHGPALIRGLQQAWGEWILLVDSDQQVPLHHFSSFWEQRQGLDALFGSRGRREEPAARRFVTICLRLTVRLALSAPLRDANTPFKLLRRAVWEESRSAIPFDCLIPSVFLAVCVHRQGRPYALLEVSQHPRVAGRASLRGLKLLRFCLKAMIQVVVFRGALTRALSATERDRARDPLDKP